MPAPSSSLLTFPDQRPFASRVKRWVGGVGLAACGVWWLLLGAMLATPDPAPALDQGFTSSFPPLVTVSLLLPVLFAVVPATRELRVAGLPFPWLVLGLLLYPAAVGTAAWFTRQAEQTERRFLDVLTRERE